MKRLLTIAFVLTATCSVFAQSGKTEKAAFDVEKLYGNWEYATGTRGGNDVGKERLAGTVTITKETFTLPGGPGAEFVMAYKIDDSKDPVQIDFDIKSGPIPAGQAKGLIKLDGDKFWLCYEPMGGDRPEKFESTEENKAHMFELKRKK